MLATKRDCCSNSKHPLKLPKICVCMYVRLYVCAMQTDRIFTVTNRQINKQPIKITVTKQATHRHSCNVLNAVHKTGHSLTHERIACDLTENHIAVKDTIFIVQQRLQAAASLPHKWQRQQLCITKTRTNTKHGSRAAAVNGLIVI